MIGLHRDGVPWFEAPIPRRWHRCRVQSTGTYPTLDVVVERCACGAISLDGRFWFERNTRRKERKS